MFRVIYVHHCLCNTLCVYCRGRAVTNVEKTCDPTPCFVLAINTFKLNYEWLLKRGHELIVIPSRGNELIRTSDWSC